MDKKPSYEELQQKVKELEKEALERKCADESLTREKTFSESIIDSLPGIFYFIDNKGIFLRWNKNLEEISEYSAEEISTMSLLDIFVEKDKANVSEKIRETFVKGRSSVEAVVVSKSGNEFYFYLTGRLVLIDNESYLVGMGIDITKRKRAEAALKESAEKIKLFAYSVSHDIKNPAIGIYLLTKYLNKNYRDILNEEGQNYCDKIMKASEDLATLVDQINVYISTKEAPLIIEKVNLRQVFDTVRDGFAAQVLVRQISWSQPENLLEINVDRLSILRVMRNFVDNALKYGGDELSEINIGYEASDGFHILSLKDDGIGIAEKDSRNIFSPFERSVTAIGIEGTGLGLAIAHEIANQHKGKVWTEPGPEKGIIFYISISKDLRLTK